ncbi:hypothetical protein B0H10DRAFT_1800970, partial [Mycena sp. CBHHK59/15]
HGSRESTPEGLSSEEADKFRSDRAALLAQNKKRREDEGRRALEDIEWSVLQAKLHSLLPARHQPTRSTFTSADLERIIGIQLPTSSSSTSLSAALLSVAPHMAQLSAGVTGDPHIEETWKLRRAFAADKSLDLVIDLMQLQTLVDPLPQTIWSIVQDQYVNFEKINAAFEVGYDHQDEPKDFAGEYELVKKEQALAKRAVKTETEWVCVFAAWRTGVCLLYPHRAAELSGYLKVVTDLFRAVPQDPSVAIRFDAEARDKYAKSPLPSGQPRLKRHFYVIFNSSKCSSSAGNQSTSSSKRAAIPCQNWNLSFCDAPCNNCCLHGTCSECGKPHRAKDNEKCLSTIQARRRKDSNGPDSASGIPRS